MMNYVTYISGYEDNKATWPIAVSWTRSVVGDKIRKKERPNTECSPPIH